MRSYAYKKEEIYNMIWNTIKLKKIIFVHCIENRVEKISMKIARESVTICTFMQNLNYNKPKKFENLTRMYFDTQIKIFKITCCENDCWP